VVEDGSDILLDTIECVETAQGRYCALVPRSNCEFAIFIGSDELAHVVKPFWKIDSCFIIERCVSEAISNLRECTHGIPWFFPISQSGKCLGVPIWLRLLRRGWHHM